MISYALNFGVTNSFSLFYYNSPSSRILISMSSHSFFTSSIVDLVFFFTCSPAGSYCAVTGLSAPSGRCLAGYYCFAGSLTPAQYPCLAGNYCPMGSATPTSCPGGFYCDRDILARPTGECQAGYYCPVGSSTPTPTPYQCPSRKFCPVGSATPVNCTLGSYCPNAGLTAPIPWYVFLFVFSQVTSLLPTSNTNFVTD